MPTVDLPAGRVHYADAGDGPPVVLLHGLLMNRTVWDPVMDLLPDGFRWIRPDLPLGSHPEPLRADADLSMRGLNALIADFLAALDLRDVTLVHSDWGGGLFLTAYGLDERVGRIVALPCEAFDNFPPGLPGKTATVVAWIPGALSLGLRQMRIPWIMRLPLLFGHMARRPLPAELVRGWTEPGIRQRGVRRDLLKYARSRRRDLIANTEALRRFGGDALILWSSAGRVMPREHGRMLADLIPNARLVEVDDAYVLSMLDQPRTVAAELAGFLTR
ncbi:alpha/beta fold hydrolase [Tsukamurella sp. 1534]|uniref:alpha/beta fold hydrolase n=1 Tax=Tsukamurella sp. 1534 TaxID=1151061 RepID=UPI000594315C|nr:alpha/beta hydrolase [Tsukamurella sp. 1534]